MDKFKTITDFYLKSNEGRKRYILLHILREFMDNNHVGCLNIDDLNIKSQDGTCFEKIVLYPTGMFVLRTPTFQMYDIDWITDDVLEDIVLKCMRIFYNYEDETCENETCFNSTDEEIKSDDMTIQVGINVLDVIKEFIHDHGYNEVVNLYSNFYLDLGFDSLDMVELAMEIEKTFNIDLDNEDRIYTVQDLIKVVKRKVSNPDDGIDKV